MNLEIKIQNLNQVLDAIEDLVDTEGMKRTVGKACALVEASAKQKAPRDTGALRRSITSEVSVDSNEISGVVFTPLEYAPYIEYGTGLFAEGEGRKDVPWCYQDDKGEWHTTSGMHPQPFMRPALEENREDILKILKEGFGN